MERTLKELLQILLDHIEELVETDGLCNLTSQLYYQDIYTHSESCYVRGYIKENKVTFYRNGMRSSYYFSPGEIKPRIKYLKKLIKKL